MKKVSLAACVTSALMLTAPTGTYANGTVRGHARAVPPATTAAVVTPAVPACSGHFSPSAELIVRPGGGGRGYSRVIFELDFMVPLYQQMDRVLFVDLRGLRDTKRNTEGNFGLGYRHLMNNNAVLGLYVYGDWRRTRNKHNFAQFTAGAEVLTNFIDARANVYLPQNKKYAITADQTAAYQGFAILSQAGYEAALRGFDGEIGARIPVPGMVKLEPRLFVGGYYFSRSGMQKVSGPKARIEVRLQDPINSGSRLTLGVEYTNDNVRKNRVFGFIGLRIPLAFTTSTRQPTGLCSRLMDYVYRDVDIVTGKAEISTPGSIVNAAGVTGIAKILHISNTATTTGTGTFEAPIGITQANAVLNATNADFNGIHFIGDNNTLTTGTLAIGNNQVVYGDTYPLAVVNTAGQTIDFPVSTTATTSQIVNNSGGPVFTTIGNSSVGVYDIDVTNSNAANASLLLATSSTSGTTNVTVSGVTIDNTQNTSANQSQIYISTAGPSNVTADLNNSSINFAATGSATPSGIYALANAASSSITLNTNDITVNGNGATGAHGILVNSAGAGSSLSWTDTGGLNITNTAAPLVISGEAPAGPSNTTVNITGATLSGLTNASGPTSLNTVFINRIAEGSTANTSNSVINVTFANSTISSAISSASTPPASTGIYINNGTNGVGNAQVTLTLNNNTLNYTGANTAMLQVTGTLNTTTPLTSPSTVTINASNNTFTGDGTSAYGSIYLLGPRSTVNPTTSGNLITLNLTSDTFNSPGAASIYVGANTVSNTTPGAININLVSGNQLTATAAGATAVYPLDRSLQGALGAASAANAAAGIWFANAASPSLQPVPPTTPLPAGWSAQITGGTDPVY